LFLLAHPCYPEKVKIIKDREYFPCVAEIIKNAKKSIKVIAFEMGYYPEYPTSPSNILIQELINARKRDVDVKVILEVSDWNKHLTEKNRYSGKILLKNGVKVKFDPPSITTHAKLIIVDSSVAVLGSTNWTYYSLTQNRELSLLVEIPSVVGELENYFDMLWEEKSFTD
ncbi:hypothetical protein H5U35_01205, partial [Candidatus Aerophobetes bacterium]|nr:hypothetical protein [Candidatus Aerophobetes bacterium]